MSVPQVVIPRVLPVKFYKRSFTPLPQYATRHLDDVPYYDQIKSFQLKTIYCQKWTPFDVINFQFEANIGPIQIFLRNCSDNSVVDTLAAQKRRWKEVPEFFVYEASLSLSGINPGNYYLELKIGGSSFITEPQQILPSAKGTILLEYANSRSVGDLIWETGWSGALRTEAVLTNFEPGNSIVAYKNQRWNPTVLTAKPFRTFKLIVGHNFGVPDYMGDKLNRIFSCDNVYIDGKKFAILDESKIEVDEKDPQYPLKTFSIAVQEAETLNYDAYAVEEDPDQDLIIISPIDGTIFGDQIPGQNLVNYEDVSSG